MDGPRLPPGWEWKTDGRFAIAEYRVGGVRYATQVTTFGDVPEIQDETTEDRSRTPPEERGTEGELANRRVLREQAEEVVETLRRWLVDHPAPE